MMSYVKVGRVVRRLSIAKRLIRTIPVDLCQQGFFRLRLLVVNPLKISNLSRRLSIVNSFITANPMIRIISICILAQKNSDQIPISLITEEH